MQIEFQCSIHELSLLPFTETKTYGVLRRNTRMPAGRRDLDQDIQETFLGNSGSGDDRPILCGETSCEEKTLFT